jgi:hypothetical protein
MEVPLTLTFQIWHHAIFSTLSANNSAFFSHFKESKLFNAISSLAAKELLVGLEFHMHLMIPVLMQTMSKTCTLTRIILGFTGKLRHLYHYLNDHGRCSLMLDSSRHVIAVTKM